MASFWNSIERLSGPSVSRGRMSLAGALAEVIIAEERYREAHHRGLAEVVRTGRGRVLGKALELSGLRADGTEIPVELTIEKLVNSDPPVFTGYVRDISSAGGSRSSS